METDDFDPAMPAWRPAVYTPDSDPRLKGNPMAEVWPGPHTDIAGKLMRHFDKRPPEFLDKHLNERIEELDRLDEFHYPFAGEEHDMRRIVSLVRSSFVARNPNNPLAMKALMAAASGRLGAMPRLSESGGGGKLGFLITGISGSGKSSFVDRLQHLYLPRPWLHESLNGRPCRWFQLGGIRVKTKRTLRATLEVTTQCIDFQLRTDYYSKRDKGASATRYENTVTGGLTGHFAPYLLLDDFERLAHLPLGDAEAIINSLIDLMEFAGVPVIVVGTIRVQKMFQRFPAAMHKFHSGGTAKFGPLQPGRDFQNFVLALQRRSVSRNPVQYSDDFYEQLWMHTAGVRRVVRETMRWVLTRHAYEEGGVYANGSLLESIFNDELGEFKPCLQVLRQVALGFDPDFKSHQQYEDFIPEEAPKIRREARDVLNDFRLKNYIAPGEVTAYMTPAVFADLRAKQREAIRQADERMVLKDAAPELHKSDVTTQQINAMCSPAPLGPSKGEPSAAKKPAKRVPKKSSECNVASLKEARKNRPAPVDPTKMR